MEINETNEAVSLPPVGRVKAGRGRPSGSRSRTLEPANIEPEVSNGNGSAGHLETNEMVASANVVEPKARINGRATRVGRGDRSNPSKINADKPIFTLSVAADILGLHPRTLRIYEEHGLVVPHRTQTQRRRYSQNDIKKFQFIQYLTRDRGVNLNGVKIILLMLDELKKTIPEPVRYIFPDYQSAD